MFGRKAKPCKVYEYRCLPPISGEDVLIEELHRKQQFWNRLVEIEHAHREKVRELLIIPDDPFFEEVYYGGSASRTVEAYRKDLKYFINWYETTNGRQLNFNEITSIDLREYQGYIT